MPSCLFDRCTPRAYFLFHFGHVGGWNKSTVFLPDLAHFGQIFPDAYGQPRHGGRTKGGGFEVDGPNDFDAYVRAELVKWTGLIKEAGIQPE